MGAGLGVESKEEEELSWPEHLETYSRPLRCVAGPDQSDFEFLDKIICINCHHELSLHGRSGCSAETLALHPIASYGLVLAPCKCVRQNAAGIIKDPLSARVRYQKWQRGTRGINAKAEAV